MDIHNLSFVVSTDKAELWGKWTRGRRTGHSAGGPTCTATIIPISVSLFYSERVVHLIVFPVGNLVNKITAMGYLISPLTSPHRYILVLAICEEAEINEK